MITHAVRTRYSVVIRSQPAARGLNRTVRICPHHKDSGSGRERANTGRDRRRRAERQISRAALRRAPPPGAATSASEVAPTIERSHGVFRSRVAGKRSPTAPSLYAEM
ncbi:hypothetical protein HPB50_002880 [Hyalomma asiaticum]|uniref:Uncharacterized protein n=1 Tax=Hyalomma asiaticum TaxID=266040 RepID=A0ACB7SEH5_HYAAI|nr:hypothetical protein HPB50_002880 [Hyalomma asiaticum]